MTDPSARIAVVFYSATGNVAALAEALAEGAREAGAETRVRPVAPVRPWAASVWPWACCAGSWSAWSPTR